MIEHFPWVESDTLQEQLKTSAFNSFKLQLRPDLVYMDGVGAEKEILEELEPGEAVAVVLESREDSKKALDLEEKIAGYMSKIHEYLNAIVAGVSSRTSKYTKCPYCGSSVSVQHIKDIACPVCGSVELLMTATHHKKLDGYRAYIAEYQARLNEVRATQRTRTINKQWLVVAK